VSNELKFADIRVKRY